MLTRTITTTRPIALPHWQTEEGTYFVTFRLFDALPADLARLKGGKRVEEALDRGFGRLAEVLHSWKGYTALRANRVLGRTGPFWQRESYDRLIRDEREFERANSYVVENPERAGLRDWKWVAQSDSRFVVRYEER